MTATEEQEKKRFENINSMLLIAFIFGLLGLLVILAAYFIERYEVNLGSPINIYIYSVIPFTFAGLLILLYFILRILNDRHKLKSINDSLNLE